MSDQVSHRTNETGEGTSPQGARPADAAGSPSLDRRRLLAGMAGLPIGGGLALSAFTEDALASEEEKRLAEQIDAVSSPTPKPPIFATLDDLKAPMPTAKLGNVELSRVVMGGNLMNGFAHSRDLIYVSRLITAYHDEKRVFETFWLAESCGVNAIITNPMLAPRINAYWEKAGGTIQFVAQPRGTTESELLDGIKYSIDHGACAAYVQGANTDAMARQGRFDLLALALETIRDGGLPAGLGAHALSTLQGCVAAGLEPDFWMKTFHHHNYWSARPDEEYADNRWCEDPEETIEFMKEREEPFIAFKVLAAGAIHPRDGLRYAFGNGADFVCLGMFDFQVVEDVNYALAALEAAQQRERPWRA